MKDAKLYLCGPINGCTDSECSDWRTEVKRDFPCALDPMRRDYRGKNHEKLAAEIVYYDKADILDCDAVLAYCPHPSVGTSMEIFFAHSIGTPVHLVVPSASAASPWLTHHSVSVSESISEALKIIKTYH